jgi:hypothetical protein
MNGWLLASLGAAVVSAFVLVRVFRWDECFDRTLDPDYHWLHPGIDRTSSVVKLTIRLVFLAAVLTIVSLYVWNGVAPRFGGRHVPVPFFDVPAGRVLAHATAFEVATAWVVVLLVLFAVRCALAPLFDVFISYKSEDVALARRVADALTAAGSRVWFAEYQVLLQRRERFQVAILRGIFKARYGLALTNDRWAESPHCDVEIRALLTAHDPERILELRVPAEELPHRRHPALAASPFLESRDVEQVVRFVAGATGLRVAGPAAIAAAARGARYTATAAGRPCSLVIDGWTLHERGHAVDGSLNGQTFRFDGLEEGTLFVNVVSGPEVTREGQRIDQGIDDRRMFDALVQWAPRHVSRVEGRVRGVHLLFHSGLSQMGLTYWARPRVVDGPAGRTRVGGYWVRKISLVIPNAAMRRSAEFVFTFAFRGTFADYCRYAHVMDAFALSLEWR